MDMPSTLMGQFMEALNSQTNLDDLNLNIDSFQGGLECNVDEVRHSDLFFIRMKFMKIPNKMFTLFCFSNFQLIQQELNIDGLLDINIPISNQYVGSHMNTTQNASIGLSQVENETSKLHNVQTTQAGVTSPSWVHWSLS